MPVGLEHWLEEDSMKPSITNASNLCGHEKGKERGKETTGRL
jgi:hypothetical protein